MKEITMQICAKCSVAKPLDEFYKKGGRRSGFRARCKQCVSVHYQTNRERIRRRDIERMYNISLDDYDNMLEEQGGGCAICGKSPEENGMRLCVDHNHKTGKIRGLLCIACNQGIGCFQDGPQFLKNAVLYLESQEEANNHG